VASLHARLLEAFLRLSGAKAITNMIDVVYPLDAKHAKPNWRLKLKHHVTRQECMGRTVYTITPKTDVSSMHVYYLHGGAYYNGFIPPHWVFLDDLVTKTKCTVTAPDFPLAPDATVDDIFAMVFPLYEQLAAKWGAKNLTVMGDSSGGGMSLVLAQKIRDAGLEQPKEVILLSPWLDVTMTNPEIKESNRKDPYLGLHACVSAGERYAKNDDPRRPDISPIYGTVDQLGPITLFVGTHDIMLPDCRKLKSMAESTGIRFEYVEYPEMIHDWMMLQLPESEKARNEIGSLIQRPFRTEHLKK